VTASPYAKLQKEAKNVMEGDPFQVECHAWGSLPLTVTWTLKGIPVVADGHHIIYKNSTGNSHVLENATLRIQSVAFEDGGDYECIAENDYGNATAKITVHVISTIHSLHHLCPCVNVIIINVVIIIKKCTTLWCSCHKQFVAGALYSVNKYATGTQNTVPKMMRDWPR